MRKEPEPQAGSRMRISQSVGGFAFDGLAYRLADDVIHDITRRVIDSARLAHLRLFFHLHLLGGEADGIAKVTLVNRAQQFHADHVKPVGTFGRVKPLDDARQKLGINLDGLGKVRLKDFAVEVVVDLMEKIIQPIENVERPLISQSSKTLRNWPYSRTLRSSAMRIKRIRSTKTLHHFVQLPGGELGIVLVNILGVVFPPARHFVKEDIVNLLAQPWRPANFREQSL